MPFLAIAVPACICGKTMPDARRGLAGIDDRAASPRHDLVPPRRRREKRFGESADLT
jgi:hypothetical protein